MSFLTIPNQESLFTTVRGGQPASESERFRPVDADEEDDDDEDDTDVRLIPRCSPIPRKRGSSIADETAEYMRIQLALSGGKRVSFADTTGGDLTDVKEFIAFDSDEEDSGKWEEEEAKYRHTQQAPNYHVHPDFTVPSVNALLQKVRTNKVEVENISPDENEPLAFCGVIRVLNISFNKAVYIRCTMDNWTSYYDHPAEYVQGSHDGDTDKFCFKLCFSAPYTTHGSRMEFVVRYETSEGDYWANNSKMNYVVTLLLSYEDKASEKHIDIRDVRSILKPPKMYRTDMDLEQEDDQKNIEGEKEDSTESGFVRPAAICPVIFQPELDVELIEASATN
ncbi:protein phosphatase 1 regulatory subunit 3A-like isoform X2 [Eucyclogobius newberryi]|uniref:protein phosphatase 1 regulatory subunit 3A-like isoform X2 n=1 Tax=Eucyclogobius newberryi TaxID=166745 RepID=UPI003B5A37C9